MSTPETDPALDQRLLSDLYGEYRVGWDKLLTRLGLPTNIGIVRTMTLGEAKEFAAKRAKKRADEGARSGGSVSSLSPTVAMPFPNQNITPSRPTSPCSWGQTNAISRGDRRIPPESRPTSGKLARVNNSANRLMKDPRRASVWAGTS